MIRKRESLGDVVDEINWCGNQMSVVWESL